MPAVRLPMDMIEQLQLEKAHYAEQYNAALNQLQQERASAYEQSRNAGRAAGIGEGIQKASEQIRRAVYICEILGIDLEAYIPDSALYAMADRIKGMW